MAATYAAAENGVAGAISNFPRARRGDCKPLGIFWRVENSYSAQIAKSDAYNVGRRRVFFLKLKLVLNS